MMNSIAPLEDAQPQVDINFTRDISEKMVVPHHIRFGNTTVPNGDYKPSVNQMNVPQRILITGGEQHLGAADQPREIEFDKSPLADAPIILQTPPRSLKVGQQKQAVNAGLPGPDVNMESIPDDVLQVHIDSTSALQFPIDQEVRLLKRHVTRLTAKVAQLEQESDFRRHRDNLLYFMAFVCFGAKFFMWVSRNRY